MSDKSALRKAAVLVASLDDETADLILAQMPEEQADAVRAEVLELGELEPDEQQQVIDEFFRVGPMELPDNPPGLPLDELNASELAIAPSRETVWQAPTSDDTPFGFLYDIEPEGLVPLLEREHPQTIALVLAHLPPERAGHVLARLMPHVQTDVVRRLVDLEETDPRVLRDVERAVEASLSRRQPSRRRMAGVATVSSILNASDRSARRQILHNLSAHDRPLAHRLGPSPAPHRRFTFVEICRLPTQLLARVVRSAPLRTVVLALAGSAPDVVEPLLDHLPHDEALRITDGLANLGSVRLSDIDHAQDDLAHLVSQMDTEGRLPDLHRSHLTAVV